ncbi:hypothetical protein EVAR_49742_1 [Eumeta japonica]|uniref:Uncharacterized protein n=1 Tax=Eumeta variegata TaxID=151549 RepID=A0A4C1YBA5_EUMVA|nr:hypothetical protein EVAR_49742_1 [Eumeta japonica]
MGCSIRSRVEPGRNAICRCLCRDHAGTGLVRAQCGRLSLRIKLHVPVERGVDQCLGSLQVLTGDSDYLYACRFKLHRAENPCRQEKLVDILEACHPLSAGGRVTTVTDGKPEVTVSHYFAAMRADEKFRKSDEQNGAAFQYLRQKFSRLSEAKIKEGIFIGPQIRNLFNDVNFDSVLEGKEKQAWNDFRLVARNFLGNKRSDNYAELVENMLSSYQKLGCNMSLKIHFLHSHLDFFPDNCGALSDEHGERFHQDIANMEKRYQGKWNVPMLADYCWTIYRDVPEAEYKRAAKKRRRNSANE